MISDLNLLTGPGMIAVGVIAIVYWQMKKHVGLEFYLYGAIFWAIAIGIKLAMDLTITTPMYYYFSASLPVLAVILLLSLYLGLRTSIFECGIVYVAVKYTKLSGMSWNEAVAMGIGFGGAEAIILGIQRLLNVVVLLLMPSLWDQLSVAAQGQYQIALIPVPVFERLFVLFCHVFATVLVIYAVKRNDWRLLAISVGIKTMLDGLLPIFGYYFGYLGAYEILPVEAYVCVAGIISLFGLAWLGKNYGGGSADARQA